MRQYKEPLFQKRHYEWLAEFCRLDRKCLPMAAPMSDAAIFRLADELKDTNPNFKPDMFLRACGLVRLEGER